MKLWCTNQGIDEEGVFCMAHLAEDRAFNCPYKDALECNKAEYPCSDYEPVK